MIISRVLLTCIATLVLHSFSFLHAIESAAPTPITGTELELPITSVPKISLCQGGDWNLQINGNTQFSYFALDAAGEPILDGAYTWSETQGGPALAGAPDYAQELLVSVTEGESKTYWLSYTLNDCTVEASILVEGLILPILNGGTIESCGPTDLTGFIPTDLANSGATGSWQLETAPGNFVDYTPGTLLNVGAVLLYTLAHEEDITCATSAVYEIVASSDPPAPNLANATATAFCSGMINPISAIGEPGSTISWYSQNNPNATPLHVGSSYTPVFPVNFTTILVYIGQSFNGCQSPLTPVTLTLTDLAEPTITGGGFGAYCSNDGPPQLTANGEAGATFSWYTDATLMVPASGALSGLNNELFTPNGPGTLYLTQSLNGCESLAGSINLNEDEPFPIPELTCTTDAATGTITITWDPILTADEYLVQATINSMSTTTNMVNPLDPQLVFNGLSPNDVIAVTINATGENACGGIGENASLLVPCVLPCEGDSNAYAITNLSENYCAEDPIIFLTSSYPGTGIWSGPGIVGTTNATGQFDPALAFAGGMGPHEISFSYEETAGCPFIINGDFSVNENLVQPIVSCTASDDSSVSIAWSNIQNSTGYTITYSVNNGPDQTQNSATNTAVINGLPLNADVDITVIANAAANFCDSPPSAAIQCTTCPLFTVNLTNVSLCLNDFNVGDSYELNEDIIELTPLGGTQEWEGNGILIESTGSFDPHLAGPGEHTITFNYTLGDCMTSASMMITITDLLLVTPTNNDGSYCSGEQLAITLSNPDPLVTFNWTALSSNLGGVSLGTGNVIDQIPINNTATTQSATYVISATLNGCTGESTIESIMVEPVLQLEMVAPQEYCGDPISLSTLNPTVAQGNPTGTYSWYADAGGSPDFAGGTVSETNGAATSYWVIYTSSDACTASQSVSVNEVCDCPDSFSIIHPADMVCDGDSISLSTMLNGLDAATTEVWTGPNGLITDPTNVVLSNLGCEPLSMEFSVVMTCTESGEAVPQMGANVFVSVFPDHTNGVVFPSTSNCKANIENNCEGSIFINYADNPAGPWSPDIPADLVPGDPSKTVFYEIELLVNAIDPCPLAGSYEVDCPLGCLTTITTELSVPPLDICSNTAVDLQALEAMIATDLDQSAVFSWYEADGSVVANPSSVLLTHSQGTCLAEQVVFTVEVDCTTDPNLDLFGGTITVNLWPTIDTSFFSEPEGCAVVVSDDCDSGSLLIDYSTTGPMDWGAAPVAPAPGDPALTVFYQITATGAPAACEFIGQFDAACELPCLTSANLPSQTANICASEELDLASYYALATTDQDDNVSYEFVDQSGMAYPALFEFTHSGVNCTTEILTLDLMISCTSNPTVVFNAGSLVVSVYPDPTDWITIAGGCSTSITDNCPGLNGQIQYSINNVDFSPIPPANLNSGDPDLIVFYQLGDPAAPGTCLVSDSFTAVCAANCPTDAMNLVSETIPACEQEVVNLLSLQATAGTNTDLEAQAIYTWLLPDGTAVPDPSNFSLPHTGADCNPESITLNLEIDCTTNANLNLNGGSVTYTVYPIPTFFEEPPACQGTIIDLCPAGLLDIQYSTDGGLSFSPTAPTDLTIGDDDQAIFYEISIPGSDNCIATGDFILSCTGCPLGVPGPITDSLTTCNGGSIMVDLTGLGETIDALVPSGGTPEFTSWYDEDLVLIENEQFTLTHSGTTCDAETYTFLANVGCYNTAGSVAIALGAGTVDVIVFPEISIADLVLPTGNSTTVTASANCQDSALEITYSTDEINFFSTPPPPPLEGEPSFTVYYEVTHSGAEDGCEFSGDFEASFEAASDCPTEVPLPIDSIVMASGNSLIDLDDIADLIVSDLDSEAVINWQDQNGSPQNGLVNATHDIGTCSIQTITYTALVNCTTDPDLDIPGATVTINLYPELTTTFSEPSDDCVVPLINECADLAIEFAYSTDGGTIFSAIPPANLSPGDSELLINYEVSFAGNDDFSFADNYSVSCSQVQGCPTTVVIPADASLFFCGSGSLDLTSISDTIMTDNDLQALPVWTLAGVEVIDPSDPPILYAGDDCLPQQIQFDLHFLCIADPADITPGGSVVVTIYPDLANEVTVVGGCVAALNTDCDPTLVSIEYSLDGGTTYTNSAPTDNLPDATPFSVDYLASYIGSDCMISGEYSVGCSTSCPQMVLNPLQNGANVVNPTFVDLTDLIDGGDITDNDAAAVFEFYINGELINEDEYTMFPVSPEIGDCEPTQFQFDLVVNCIAGTQAPIPAGSWTMNSFPPVIDALFAEPTDGCQVAITELCDNGGLTISYSLDEDAGFSSTVPAGPAPGEEPQELFYQILITGSPMQGLVTGSYFAFCPGSCPVVINGNLPAAPLEFCETASIDLTALQASINTDDDTNATYHWTDQDGNSATGLVELNHMGTSEEEMYSFDLSIGCVSDPTQDDLVGTVNVLLYTDATLSLDLSDPICLDDASINAVDLSDFITSESATGTWASIDDPSLGGSFPVVDFSNSDTMSYAFEYTVLALNAVCDNATDQVIIEIIDCTVPPVEPIEPEYIAIPAAFSPNGSFPNDEFQVLGQNFAITRFLIYNRWGELVHEAIDNTAWDGTDLAGQPVEMAVYLWYIEGTYTVSGNSIEENKRRGNVTLVR